MRISFGKTFVFIISAAILSFAAYQIFQIHRAAQKTLADERARLLDKNRVPFEKKILTPHLSQNVLIIQNTLDTRDLVKFKDSYFAATGGGLVQLGADGKLIKHFSVLDGLPESDLTSLAIFQGKLMIGTRTKSLVVFDGEKFENYLWTGRETGAVTSFLESDGKLLIGTFAGGLLEFDGADFQEIKAEDRQIGRINCLARTDAKLYVGTFDNGLWLRENDTWTHFTTAGNLPSNRIVGIAAKDRNLFVATDFGPAVLEENHFRPLGNLPALTGLTAFQNQLFLTQDDGKIFTLAANFKEFSGAANLQKAHLTAIDDRLFLLSGSGISVLDGAKIKPFGQPDKNSLTDNFVSALAFDKDQNCWVGTFRRGIDVLASDGHKITHLETESAREINFLAAGDQTVTAATAGGMLNFKNNFSVENLTKKDGLPSNSITHFAGDWTATARGLAFRQNGRIRVLSNVQGLPNNSVYTTLQIGRALYAGTLGGLAVIEDGKIVRTFKDSNSNLKTNWVTALIAVKDRLFIGTYGGGIYEFTPSGEIRSFEAETGKFVVNPNAFYTDGSRLYAGTLDGVKILDLETQGWSSLRELLPAATVMSIAGSGDDVYFGTAAGIARIASKYFAGERNASVITDR